MNYRSKSFAITLLVLLLLFTAKPSQAQIESVEVRVDGMSCPFCAYGLEKKLKKIEGVHELVINIDKGSAKLIAKDSVAINIAAVRPAVKDAGFTPREMIVTVTGFLIERDGTIYLIQTDDVTRFAVTGESAFLSFAKSAISSKAAVRIIGDIDNVRSSNNKSLHQFLIKTETFEEQ